MATNKIACFNLPGDVRDKEIEDLFYKFGRIQRIAVRNTREGATMAFVEFEDSRDAEDAVRDRHGYPFDGTKLRVELSFAGGDKGKGKRSDSRGRKGGFGKDSFYGDKGGYDKGYDKGYGKSKGYGKRSDSRDRFGKGGKYGGGKYGDSKGYGKGKDYYGGKDSYGKGYGKYGDSKGDKGKGKGPREIMDHWFRVIIEDLPENSSWQDLKDFLRGSSSSGMNIVRFTEVKRVDGKMIGLGGYEMKDDALDAVEKLDGTDFRARDGNVEKVRVSFDPSSGVRGGGEDGRHSGPAGGGRERSRSRSRSRGGVAQNHRSRSASRGRSRSGSGRE